MIHIILLDLKEKWRGILILPFFTFCILLIFKITNLFIHFPLKDLYAKLNKNFIGFIGLSNITIENDFYGVWIIFITYFSIIYMIHSCNIMKKILNTSDDNALIIYHSEILKSSGKLFISKLSIAIFYYIFETILCAVASFTVIIIDDIEKINLNTFSTVFKNYFILMLIGFIFFALGVFHEAKTKTFLDNFTFSVLIVISIGTIGRMGWFVKILLHSIKINGYNFPKNILHFLNSISSRSHIFKLISPLNWCGYGHTPTFDLIFLEIVSAILILGLSAFVFCEKLETI